MRVLMVTNMWPSAERPHWGAFVKSQVDSLEAAGCDTSVYEIQGYRSRLNYFHAMAQLPRVAIEQRAELVHAHYGLSGAAAARVNLPLVVSFCGDDLLGRPDAAGHLSFLSRALIPVSRHAARRAACRDTGISARLRSDRWPAASGRPSRSSPQKLTTSGSRTRSAAAPDRP